MTVERSKRLSLLALTFIAKSTKQSNEKERTTNERGKNIRIDLGDVK